MSESIKVDIWSDIACPWCYIGKRKLEDAIGRFKKSPEAALVEIEYHSFELAPDTPVDFEGSEIDFLVGHKRLPEQQVKEMLGTVTTVARSVGLDYDFEALQHTNTVKAHELLHYAKEHGKQLEAKERLLRAYFVEGRHIGHVDELAQLAAEIGLDPEDVSRSLDADEHRAAVRADQELAARLGINAVPFFVIDGRYGISGAQRPETFLDALRQAAAHKAEEAVAS